MSDERTPTYRTSAETFCDEHAARRVLLKLDPPIDPELVGLDDRSINRRHIQNGGTHLGEYATASDTYRMLAFIDGSAAIFLEGEGQSRRWEVLRQ